MRMRSLDTCFYYDVIIALQKLTFPKRFSSTCVSFCLLPTQEMAADGQEWGDEAVQAMGVMEKKLKNTLPLYGNKESMNMNSMILTNIVGSPYFKEELINYKTFHEVIDEVYYKVSFLFFSLLSVLFF